MSPHWAKALAFLGGENEESVNTITKTEVRRVWELIQADAILWDQLRMLEPRLPRSLSTPKERLIVAELFSNLVQALMQKGW